MSKITYHREGYFYIPDIYIKDNKKFNLGKYGLMGLNYLKEYKKGIYKAMWLQGTLQKHLVEIDKECKKLENKIVKEIAEKENINEELKQKNQMEWVQLMNATQNQAQEIILNEIIWR